MEVLNHLSLRYISLAEVEIKTEGTFVVDLEMICIGNAHHIIKSLEVDIEVTLTEEGISVIIPEVVRDTETITMIIEETITEVKVMIGIEVDHYTDKTEVGEEIGV